MEWVSCKGQSALIEQFPELSDDDYVAFLQLQAEFRQDFESKSNDHNANWEYLAADYMNKTLAAAKALDIDALCHYEVHSPDSREFHTTFTAFIRDVDNIIIQMRVHHSRRSRSMSVGLAPEQKAKIHALVDKIRQEIEASSASTAKKESLYVIISNLTSEIDKDRTGLERFGDLARGLSGISRELADGAEPWWKWFKAVMGVVDDAKESEPRLPKPKDIKRIEPPRKGLPKPSSNDIDDEIPF